MCRERFASRKQGQNKSLQTQVFEVTHIRSTSQLPSGCGWVGVDKLWCVKTTATSKCLMVPSHAWYAETLCIALETTRYRFQPPKVFFKALMGREGIASRRLRPNKTLQTRVCDVTHMSTTSQLSSYCGWVGVDKLWCVKTTATPKKRDITEP